MSAFRPLRAPCRTGVGVSEEEAKGGAGLGARGFRRVRTPVLALTPIWAGAAAAQVNSDVAGNREEEPEDPDQPVFSLVSGKYRHAKRYGGKYTCTGGTRSGLDAVISLFVCRYE